MYVLKFAETEINIPYADVTEGATSPVETKETIGGFVDVYKKPGDTKETYDITYNIRQKAEWAELKSKIVSGAYVDFYDCDEENDDYEYLGKCVFTGKYSMIRESDPIMKCNYKTTFQIRRVI